MKSASHIPIKLPSYNSLAIPRGVPVAAVKFNITEIALATCVAQTADFRNHIIIAFANKARSVLN